MSNELFTKIILSLLTLSFIIVILIKRFIYFKPGKYSEIYTEKYTDIKHGHLHAWLLDNQNTTHIILYCKDRTGNITHCQEKINKLRDLGYKVMIFDYSGYGRSSGIPSEQQLYDDGTIMTFLIKKQYLPNQIILYGEGIGASIALHVAIKHGISIVILDSPLSSINVLAKKILGKAKFLSFPFTEFNIEPLLRAYKGRLLMFNNDMLNIQSLSTTYIDIKDPPWDDIKKFIGF
jgi:alpha-beta hydrolase superfamily lysophospholipase